MVTTEQLHQRFLDSTGVSTDTRAIAPGSMFFALKGPRFDANAFATEALAKGARWAVVDDPEAAHDERCLLVPDTLRALQELATVYRRAFGIPMIAITGSNGKTTTKELMHAVLSADRPTLATTGNLNNHIGVPLTLLRLTNEHRIAIIEMGANKPGDIDELMRIAEPTHGLITNIGKAHLEGFGGYAGVLRTKTELYRDLGQRDGSLFVNADDAELMRQSEGMRRHTYGTGQGSDTLGVVDTSSALLRFRFRGTRGAEHTVATRLVGAYNLPNALAAVAIGQHFQVPDERIAAAIAGYEPGNNRSQLTDSGRNLLILDAYNANPTSMATALENLAAMASDRPKAAVLGDMLELGKEGPAEHAAIVALADRLGIEARYVGPLFSAAAPDRLCWPDAESLRAHLAQAPMNGRLVLIKGSRGIRLETVVPAL